MPSLSRMLKPHIFEIRGAYLEGPDNSGPVSCSLHRLQNTRVFFSKSVKKSVKRAVRVLRTRSARASLQGVRGKSVSPQVSLSVFSLVPDPFVWLLAHTWIRKNTDCFAVYSLHLKKIHFLQLQKNYQSTKQNGLVLFPRFRLNIRFRARNV